MNGAGSSANDTITQLNAARNLALGDAAYYPQIVPGVVPIIGANASLDLRRWGADFLAETFASPTLAGEEKQKLSLVVLQTLKDFLENPSEDTGVVKSVVQAAASIYPLVVRHTITNPTDGATWQKMASIKSSILRRMDTAPAGVRICCIKFVQKVVQTQTPGLITDPRRTEQNEISLSLVPRDHPLIPPSNLEAEASGLLDRLFGVLQENESDALIITATLNSLGVLVRTRASVANKIVSTVLNFNPFKQANSPMTPKTKVMVKSTARTTRAFLMNILKKNPNHPMAGRIQGYIERLHQSLVDIFDETSRKRAAPSEPTDGLDSAKRQRLGADVPGTLPGRPDIPALPQGPVSYAQLFTLTTDEGSKSFDVQTIPIELVVQILVPILAQIGVTNLNDAINAVRARYLSLGRTPPTTALDAAKLATGAPPQGDDDEDDDYEPDYPIEDAEQIVNKLNNAPPDDLPPERPPEKRRPRNTAKAP
ncbi:hypothetical protein B0A49_11621 [Cryomyces minteri]|uniref:Symplekin/Pta1 N-terminal domain-containing protein n=1 Tax=Cryomyces minteri TaxID=331657 RepID=A0A4U0VPK1_9PEZI|nr:hypothetical protein B0A49_11621 [Cryomyces minteri]